MTTRQVLLAIPLLGVGWFGTLLVVSFTTDAAPGYVVLFPTPDFYSRLDPDMSILAAGRMSVTLAAKNPRVAARLYGAGAWIVLPAGLPGCLPVPGQ